MPINIHQYDNSYHSIQYGCFYFFSGAKLNKDTLFMMNIKMAIIIAKKHIFII